jgi:UDP-N-acetylmuramoyl-L-alanyl-D-glutamate--2,6-diaminopimelate ligase
MGKIAAKYADLIVLTAEDPRTEDVNEIIDEIAQGCLKGGAKLAKKHLRGGWMPSSEMEGKERLYGNKKPKFDSPGVKEQSIFFKIPDRRQAIQFAIRKLAKKGDIVVILGKGHERSMCFGKREYPWSDQEEAQEALKKLKTKKFK